MTNYFDLLSVYPAKGLEYSLAVGYLLLFIPFWRYVQGGKAKPAVVHAEAKAPAEKATEARAPLSRRPAWTGWFQVPGDVHLHPGHTWARLEADGLVTVGVDDFAHKLVGPAKVDLPTAGAEVHQGESAIAIGHDGRMVPLLSPVDGKVVAVNARARDASDGAEDPYGAGWLFKVRPSKLSRDLHQLLSGSAAGRFMEDASERLALQLSPELGQVLQDGGVPVHGIAEELAGDGWDRLARGFFLT